MENISLSELKSSNRKRVIQLYKEFNIRIPKDADLEYLRGYLRLRKIQAERSLRDEDTDSFDTESLNDNEHLYDSVDETLHNSSVVSTTSSPSNSQILPQFSDTKVENEYLIPVETMAEKTPCFQPTPFSGGPTENVKDFFQQYDLIGQINQWNDTRKLQLLPFYLTGTAKIILDNLTRQHQTDLTWDIVKTEFKKTFSKVANTIALEMTLNARKQRIDETIVQYIASVEDLCFQVNPDMAETRICGHILKGMNPAILQQIVMFDNTSRTKLRENLQNFESSNMLLRHSLGVESYDSPLPKADISENTAMTKLVQMVNQLQLSVQKIENSRGRSRERGSSRSQGRRHDFSPYTDRPSSNRRYRSSSRSQERRSSKTRYDRRHADRDMHRRYRSSSRSRERRNENYYRSPERKSDWGRRESRDRSSRNVTFADDKRRSNDRIVTPKNGKYFCDLCKRSGHTSDFCYVRRYSKN